MSEQEDAAQQRLVKQCKRWKTLSYRRGGKEDDGGKMSSRKEREKKEKKDAQSF